MSKKPVTQKPEPPTTGHTWDGIRGIRQPDAALVVVDLLPTIIWGLGYTILYPCLAAGDAGDQGYLGRHDARGGGGRHRPVRGR